MMKNINLFLTITLLISIITPSLHAANTVQLESLTKQKKSLTQQVKDFANCLKSDKDCDPKKVKITRTVTAIIGTLILIAASGTVFYAVSKHKKGKQSEIPPKEPVLKEEKESKSKGYEREIKKMRAPQAEFLDQQLADIIQNNDVETTEMLDRAKSLISQGADVNTRSGTQKIPILILAIKKNQPRMAELLLNNNAKKTIEKWSALELAKEQNNQAIIKLLMRPTPVPTKISSPISEQQKLNQKLITAARDRKIETIEQLLKEKDIDVNATTDNGTTALHWAVIAREPASTQMTELLLKNKAYINAPDNNNTTPLMEAAANGRASVVTLLIIYGANLDAQNKQGQTALDIANLAKEQMNDPEKYDPIIKLLDAANTK